MLVRRRIQTPSVVGTRARHVEGEVVLGAPPPARLFFLGATRIGIRGSGSRSAPRPLKGRFAPGFDDERLGGPTWLGTVSCDGHCLRGAERARQRDRGSRPHVVAPRLGPAGQDAARRRRGPRRAAGDPQPDLPRGAHLRRDGTAARQAVGLRGVAAVRLVRGEPDPARPSRLGEGTARAGRAARRDVARRLPRDAGVGQGATGLGLLAVPARPSQQLRPAPPVRRVLRRLRRAIRRPARRLRARHEDGRGASRLRSAQGRAGTAGRRRPRGGRASGTRRELPDRPAEGVRAEGDRAVRLRSVRMAPRHRGPPVRVLDRDHRHPPDDALLRGQPRRALRDDARVRPRALRARRRPRARAHSARARRFARPARVAEPNVGEHGRPQPPVLAVLLPAADEHVPGGARRPSSSRTGTGPSTGSSPH